MSYTSVQATQMNDQNLVVESLKNLGYTPEVLTEGRNIRGDRGETSSQKCTIILKREDTKMGADVGFCQAGSSGMFDIVTDTYVNRGFSLTEFSQKVRVGYQKAFARRQARKNGATFLGEKTLPDGTVKMRFEVRA